MVKRVQWLGILTFVTQVACASFQSGGDALIKKLDPTAHIGVSVLDLTTGATLYQRQAEERFVPASNMKLFSDAAALMVLGPDYRFTNRLSTTASQLKSGQLDGSLYLYLSGDPTLSHERLAALLKQLRKWHVSHIHGNIVVQSTHDIVTPAAPGWVHKDLAYSYGAPLGPVMLDANRLRVTVNPGEVVGAKAIVEVTDPSHTIQVINQVTTQASPKGCGVGFLLDKKHQLLVKGCIAKGAWSLDQGLAIQNPFLYLQGVIKTQLKKMGVVLDGQIILGQAPSSAIILATDHSKLLSHIMADTLKPSDNLYADSLFLHAAAVLYGRPVNWLEAQTVVKQFLQQQTGIDLTQAILTDGSGLSRDDRLTPKQTTQLLEFLYHKFPLTYEYIAALPVSGRDGTLATRLKKPSQQDFIRAKTGTMTGVNSLSGYIYTANGHTLAFSMYYNRKPKVNPRVSGRVLIDALCDYFLAQNPPAIAWSKFFTAHKRLSFQEHLTQDQIQRQHQARWRRIESAVKSALKDQPVSVLYQPDTLLIVDKQANPERVYRALEKVAKQYPFSLALSSTSDTLAPKGQIHVLLTDAPPPRPPVTSEGRYWMIKELITG